ncbi:MAG: ankyrin repeat domain-containing protein [Candidatus Xenobiia bacterium LiM19]
MKRFITLLSILLILCAGICSADQMQQGGSLALSDDETKVMNAVESGDLAKVKALIEKSPSLAKLPIVMLRAVIGNRIDIVKYLLSKGADVNADLNSSETAVIVSCHQGDSHLKMTQYLISQGASLEKKSNNGNSVLMFAIRGCFQSIEGGEKSSPPFETIKLLLSKGVSVNSANDRGETPLMLEIKGWAGCFGCNPAIVKLLMEKGADVNARSKEGKTVLTYAAEIRKTVSSEKNLTKRVDDCILLLKKAGAKK